MAKVVRRRLDCFAQYMLNAGAVENNCDISNGLTLCDGRAGLLRQAERSVAELKELIADLQVATATLGLKYHALVCFLRENKITDYTARELMRKGGMRKERISEVFRVVRGPQDVVEALGKRLIGFKAAIKAARLRESVQCGGRAFRVWRRFLTAFRGVVESHLRESSLTADDKPIGRLRCYDRLLKSGESVEFQCGAFWVVVRREEPGMFSVSKADKEEGLRSVREHWGLAEGMAE